MNIYEKLTAARAEFHSDTITKGGKNAFSNYSYFELSDIVVRGLPILTNLGLTPLMSCDKESAQLVLVNNEKPEERIVFTAPMGGAALKGTHEIQQIGAVITYERRYLYAMLWDLVEHDAIDSAPPPDPKDLMDEAKDLGGLKAIYAELYRAATPKERVTIKAHYEKLRDAMMAAEPKEGE